MLRYTYNQKGFSFYFLNDLGNKVPVSDWQALQSECLLGFSILNELYENGLAVCTDNTCTIETVTILKLNETDRQAMGMPKLYPYEILVESDGTLSQKNFRFKYEFYDFVPNGSILIVNRNGAIVKNRESEYLLSEEQYKVCEAIDEFNNLPEAEKGKVTNLKKLSELKNISNYSGIEFELFLKNQELCIPDKIKLSIDFENGALEITPTVDIDDPSRFTKLFDRYSSILDTYPISKGDGRTTSVVFSDSQKSELSKIKQNRRLSDRKRIQEIVEHPELFFDDDEVDFSVFYSERVKDIGVYTPKFYPFVSPYKSQWIPGIRIKDNVHGETRIYFKTPETLLDFIEQKEIAVHDGRNFMLWQDTEINIGDAEKFIKTAEKQFEKPNEPITKQDIVSQEVLIIKENAEITEFSSGTNLPNGLNHSFYKVSNLHNNIRLKEHQKEGISWLQSLFRANFSGGLLADDMGLGKTLQLLYFFEWHSQNFDSNKPYLIVAPVSLLENWELEYQKFFSPQSMSFYKLYGKVGLTKENNLVKNLQDAKQLQFKQIILTNYETLRLYQISLGLVDFAIVALDEAQKIKTPGTLITNASKALKADFKIAVTGTPVENSLVDIWCLMDFAVPGLLGNAKEFSKEYQKPLGDENTNVKLLTERLRNKIGEFIKRRLKSDVAKDLPRKYDNADSRIKKVMPSVQLDRYKQEIEIANSSLSEGIERRNQKLKSIWAIRDISDHPYLLEKKINEYYSKEEVQELIKTSAKLQTTVNLLVDIQHKEEKVIIFADRRETQRMLQNVIRSCFGTISSIINGDTPTQKQDERNQYLSRQQTIERFQSEKGFNVIIMSPIAAGVGLNVIGANHVIHYSRHWNPAKEEQATDRAYRIGQQKDVFVYYPMAVFPDSMRDANGDKLKSFDEILDILLKSKKELAISTLFPTEQAEVTPDELFGSIFSTKAESNSKPLTLEDIDKLYPNLFEASIASLYEKQGFEVQITPYAGDKGVDVVALKDGENYLIQVKQSRSSVGNSAVQEICTAKRYYENMYSKSFNLLTVTNNSYSASAVDLAKSNNIKLLNRRNLELMIVSTPITMKDVNRIESQRMTTLDARIR